MNLNFSQTQQQGYFKAHPLQFLFLLIFALFQILLCVSVYAAPESPEVIWEENEFPGDGYTAGGFKINDSDFIVATGKYWQGSPPPSTGSFNYKNETVVNSGQWNNDSVRMADDFRNLEEITARLEAGVKFDPHFFPFRYNLGRLYMASGKTAEAIIELEYAAAEMPDYYKTFIHLANLYFIAHDEHAAELLLKKAVSLDRFDTEALLLLAEYALKNNLQKRARFYINEAMKIDSQNPNVALGLAEIATANDRQFDAWKIFRNSETVYASGKLKKYSRKFHYYRAMTAFTLQKFSEAQEEFKKILLYPYDPFFLLTDRSFVEKMLKRAETMSLEGKSR